MIQLVIIRGLPGSGKSTMAKVLALVGYEHHEADQFFMVDGEYKFDRNKLSLAHASCLDKTKISLLSGHNCVVSNTFTRRWEMQPYIDFAASVGADVRIIEATGAYENVHGVPDDAIEAMRRRWEST